MIEIPDRQRSAYLKDMPPDIAERLGKERDILASLRGRMAAIDVETDAARSAVIDAKADGTATSQLDKAWATKRREAEELEREIGVQVGLIETLESRWLASHHDAAVAALSTELAAIRTRYREAHARFRATCFAFFRDLDAMQDLYGAESAALAKLLRTQGRSAMELMHLRELPIVVSQMQTFGYHWGRGQGHTVVTIPGAAEMVASLAPVEREPA